MVSSFYPLLTSSFNNRGNSNTALTQISQVSDPLLYCSVAQRVTPSRKQLRALLTCRPPRRTSATTE